MRVSPLLLTLALAAACGEDPADDAPVVITSMSGRATWMDYKCKWIAGAQVCLGPDRTRCASTDKDGAFTLTGLHAGTDAYLVFHASQAAAPVQTATYRLTAAPIKDLSYQVPTDLLWKAFEGLVGQKADPTRCQVSTTVMANGKLLWPCEMPGEAGATVTISPALPAGGKHGPVYFNHLTLPDPKLTETTADGGAVFVNVPPGDYTLHAHKAGKTYDPIKVTCRAGVLVNPSPPWGFKPR